MPWIEEERPDGTKVRFTIDVGTPRFRAGMEGVQEAAHYSHVHLASAQQAFLEREPHTGQVELRFQRGENQPEVQYRTVNGNAWVPLTRRLREDNARARELFEEVSRRALRNMEEGGLCPNCNRPMVWSELTERYECPVSGLTVDAS